MVTTDGAGAPRPDVTVVVPSSGSDGALGRCLRSLAAQTLAASRFEVVVVVAGPGDGVDASLAAVAREHPGLRLRTVRSARPGAARARNLGVAAAAGRHLAFVDAGDRVSPGYLEGLLAHAAPGVVPLALVAEVDAAGVASFAGEVPRRLVPRAGTRVGVAGSVLTTGHVTAALVPAGLARATRFDETLDDGEGVLFWFDAFAARPFVLQVCEPRQHAVYYRDRSGERDVPVAAALDVVERLAARPVDDGSEPARVRQAMIDARARLVGRHVGRHPDELDAVRAEVGRRGLWDVVSRRDVQHDVARDLAVLYVFMPYADTSARVATRRLRTHGVVVDVVSNDMQHQRAIDPSTIDVADDFVGRHLAVPIPPTVFGWRNLQAFCVRGYRQVEQWVEEKGEYRSLYSRTMLPGSHLLAALVKLRWPATRWVAEFSDPVVWDAYGEERPARPDPDGWVMDELRRGLAAAGHPLDPDVTVAELVELVAYVLADEVHFTNENQRTFMLGYHPDRALAEAVRARSVVLPHPTLPREFYARRRAAVERVPDRVNVAYFGAFYATRGLTEVVDALERLAPDERRRVVLRVFTADPDALRAEVAARGLADVIDPAPYVPYLEFLELTTRMDVLLVNDAHTRHLYPVNPYLPSKWSDYAGSGTDVWAVVEPGSVLDGLDVRYRSTLSDVDGAVAQLRRILADHAVTAVPAGR
jgi:glycosyltransferase involved in cell wall biosynthesis